MQVRVHLRKVVQIRFITKQYSDGHVVCLVRRSICSVLSMYATYLRDPLVYILQRLQISDIIDE